MRFTIGDLTLTEAQEVELLEQLNKPLPQPPSFLHYFDPFDGLGDFDVHPDTHRLYHANQLCQGYRDQWSMALAKAEAAHVALKNVEAIMDRPLSKLPKKDLIVLIRAAQDVIVNNQVAAEGWTG